MPRTALQWASADGDAHRVRLLLTLGEQVSADDWVRAPRTSPGHPICFPWSSSFQLMRQAAAV